MCAMSKSQSANMDGRIHRKWSFACMGERLHRWIHKREAPDLQNCEIIASYCACLPDSLSLAHPFLTRDICRSLCQLKDSCNET